MHSAASPAASSSTLTMAKPAPEAVPRPLRQHHRSVSSDAIVPSASYIFVSPASPDEKGASLAAAAAATQSSASGGTSPIPRQRRVKLFGFTPADGSPMIGSPEHLAAKLPESAKPSTSFSFGENAVNGGRNQGRSASESHISFDGPLPPRATAMVRKKSGELVRSSLKTGDSLRREDKPRSAPATPTCPKYVHFDTQLEHVKHFLAQQRPAAVSRSGSPVETETEDEPESYPFPAMASGNPGVLKLRLPNFPARINHDQDAYVETLEVGKDGKTIRGVVRVRNVAFEKWVAVRFTLDHWQTVSEVSAEHHESMGANSDRFAFTIKLQDLLARIEEKTMFIAVRYTAGGREIWDNNGGQNYRVEFFKVKPQSTAPIASKPIASASKGVGASGPGVPQRQTWSVVNAGQAADRMADLRRELDRLVKDDVEPAQILATRSFTEGSPSALSGRYDFGASLKAFGAHSQRTGQSPNLDGFVPLNASPPKSVHQSLAPPVPASPHRPKPAELSQANLSPRSISARPEPTPDFGKPSTSAQFAYSPSLGLHSPVAYAPPGDTGLAANLYKTYQQYSPIQESAAHMSTSHTRFASFPGALSPPSQAYSPLLPPSFRGGRRHDSPLASPAPSPSRSPMSSSPPRRNSPPLESGLGREDGLWSPASSTTSSTVMGSDSTVSTSSPTSEPTSVPESPSQGFQSGLASPNNDLNHFLDKFCFNTTSGTSSLGLSGPADHYYAATSDYSSTPRRMTPTQMSTRIQSNPASCAAAHFSSSGSSSGSSTPNREDGAIDSFAGFNSSFSTTPTAIIS